MFVIENDVPVPENAKGERGRPRKYPWPDMRPGDSVFILEPISQPSGSLSFWKRKNPEQRFVTRSENGGTRIWRLA